MRQVTFSFVGDAPRSKVALKAMPNLPSSSCESCGFAPVRAEEVADVIEGFLLFEVCEVGAHRVL